MNNQLLIYPALVGTMFSISPIANAQHQDEPHAEQAAEQAAEQTHEVQDSPYEDPPLIEGTTIDDALRAAAAAPPESWPEPIHDNPTLSFTLIEQLEFRASDDQPDQVAWDAQGWIGNDDQKFWWKTEGAAAPDGPNDGELEFQALYAKPISPFWFLQAGLRYENTWGPGDSKDRTSLVLGLQGLAPYKFELEPVLFLTEDGDLLGRLTASYDIYITQRLALQPRTELNISATDVADWGLGSGFNDLSLEFRLRYEIRREFAPYVGLSYLTLLGETANIAEQAGSSTDDLQFVFGIRLAF
ncbi:MAG: copper resistance protein B [Phycisphaerales bacterium]|nr:copper resistance protein B [Phycisphaerales bacterium]